MNGLYDEYVISACRLFVTTKFKAPIFIPLDIVMKIQPQAERWRSANKQQAASVFYCPMWLENVSRVRDGYVFKSTIISNEQS